jgi:D-alanyl-D-alanine dipeptidase
MNDKKLVLEVVYGYRSLSIQTKLFNENKERISATLSGNELLEATHNIIAVPEVSGHPTGGAVDIQITKAGKPLDFGTKIWEFNNNSFVFSPFISVEAKENRMLLRGLMMKAGFAPFDGEWWHFSYGDKEWARYYGKPHAIYDQVEFSK